jgi:hypothetical protein
MVELGRRRDHHPVEARIKRPGKLAQAGSPVVFRRCLTDPGQLSADVFATMSSARRSAVVKSRPLFSMRVFQPLWLHQMRRVNLAASPERGGRLARQRHGDDTGVFFGLVSPPVLASETLPRD